MYVCKYMCMLFVHMYVFGMRDVILYNVLMYMYFVLLLMLCMFVSHTGFFLVLLFVGFCHSQPSDVVTHPCSTQ